MAVLTGGVIVVSGKTTTDQYYLANELSTYQVDYWPVHSSYITKLLNASLPTTHFPIANPARALLSPVKIAHDYFYDFYFRIHYSTFNINAGLTLSEQTYSLEIWNSYLTTDTLNSVNLNGLTISDVTLGFPFSLPHDFKPLENSYIDLTVLPGNSAGIDGNIQFNWTTESTQIGVVATHVSIWPFAALVNFTETKSWLTDVIASRLGEQRFSIREYPRTIYNYKYRFLDNQEFTTAKNIAKNKINEPMAVPLFNEVVKLNNLTIGQVDIIFDTSYLELEVGDLVMFWESYLKNEVLEVLEIQAEKIILKTPLTLNYTKACLALVKSGYLTNGISLTENTSSLREGSLEIQFTKSYFSPVWPTSDVYKTFPVLVAKNISSGGIESTFNREQDSIDSITGILEKIDSELYNRKTYGISLAAHTRKSRFILRRQLDYLKGKFTTFWVRSSIDDLKNLTDVIAGNNSIKVKSTLGSRNKYTDIYIKGSIEAYFAVLNITDNFDGTESITLSPTPTVPITNIVSIQQMLKVRADTDTLTYNYDSNIMSVNFIVKEIL